MNRKDFKNPTVRDVAQHASVSVGTVSNVLNARGNVSAARRASVEASMAALGFQPNRVAQSLRRSESRVIGLCTPLTSSAYFAALLETFESVAAQQDYEVMQVLSHADPTLELRRVQALIGRNVDGLILIPTHDPSATLSLLAVRGTPTVIVDRVFDDARFDYFAIDDRAAMRAATAQVIALGHRRLLYVVRDMRLPTTQRRIEGYRDAAIAADAASTGHTAEAASGSICAAVLQRDPDEAAFAREIQAALTQNLKAPTVLIASNSVIALSLIRLLGELGVRWPDDVSVLVFDEPVWAPILTPPLAVMRHPTQAIALAAWERLLARLATPDLPPIRVMFEASLVGGPSLAAPRLGHQTSSGSAKDKALAEAAVKRQISPRS
ncbi:MAG: LacI family DNA-binding transcriptional regulator [Variovorax sp.]